MSDAVLDLIEKCAQKLHENCPYCDGTGTVFEDYGGGHSVAEPCASYEHARQTADIVITEAQTEFVFLQWQQRQVRRDQLTALFIESEHYWAEEDFLNRLESEVWRLFTVSLAGETARPGATGTADPGRAPTPLSIDEISEAMFASATAVDRQLNTADCDELAKAAVSAGRSGKSITAVLASIDRGRIVAYCDPDEEHDLDAFKSGTEVQVFATGHARLHAKDRPPGGEVTPSVGEVAAFTARLRVLSGRLARFEPVDPAELAEFEALRDRLLGETT